MIKVNGIQIADPKALRHLADYNPLYDWHKAVQRGHAALVREREEREVWERSQHGRWEVSYDQENANLERLPTPWLRETQAPSPEGRHMLYWQGRRMSRAEYQLLRHNYYRNLQQLANAGILAPEDDIPF